MASLRPESMMMTPPAAHLAAGARGRGNGDDGRHDRRDPGRAALDEGIGLQRIAGMGRHQADRIGEIHRRAAADGDDAVAAPRPL